MIDFRCVQCGKLLRTPDDAAGKQAQCPSCGGVQPIPSVNELAAAGNPFQDATAMPLPAAIPNAAAANPYAGSSYETSAMGSVGTGPIVPTPLDAGDVLARTWQIARPQIVWLFLFGLIYLVVSWGAGMGLQFAIQLLQLAANAQGPTADAAGVVVVQFVAQFVSIFLSLGAVIYMLKMARGQPASFLDFLGGAPYFLRAVIASFLVGLILLGVLLLCAVPALVAAVAIGVDSPVTIGMFIIGTLIALLGMMVAFLVFGQFMYVLVDRDAGVFESLTISRQITVGNRLTILLVYLLVTVVALAGFCALCLPYFFAIGFGFLMLAVAYLTMTGQPTAAQTILFGSPAHPANPE